MTSRAGTSHDSFKDVCKDSSSPVRSSTKRKYASDDHGGESGVGASSPVKKKLAPKGSKNDEKRLLRFRPHPPQSYLERLDRVRTQRMYLIDRNWNTSEDGTHKEEVFDIAGTTGNIYQVTISKVPDCNCPDSRKGNQCKHIIYVLVNVLKAPEDLAYQRALLVTELNTIFSRAPPTPQANSESTSSTTTDTGGHRKPIEGDCPICVMEFDISDSSEEIVWCRAACGQNIHEICFEQWAKSKPGTVKCVYCRSVWKGDEEMVKKISKDGRRKNRDGYVNVAGELGLSSERDVSSYHQPWVEGWGGRRRVSGWY